MSRLLVTGKYEGQNLFVLRFAEGPTAGQIFQNIQLYSRFNVGNSCGGYFVAQTSEQGCGRLTVHRISRTEMDLPVHILKEICTGRKGKLLRHGMKVLWATSSGSARRGLFHQWNDPKNEKDPLKKILRFLGMDLNTNYSPQAVANEELDAYYQALRDKDKAIAWIAKKFRATESGLCHQRFRYEISNGVVDEESIGLDVGGDGEIKFHSLSPDRLTWWAGDYNTRLNWSPLHGLIRLHGLDVIGNTKCVQQWRILKDSKEAKKFIAQNNIKKIVEGEITIVLKDDQQVVKDGPTWLYGPSTAEPSLEFIVMVYKRYKNNEEVWT